MYPAEVCWGAGGCTVRAQTCAVLCLFNEPAGSHPFDSTQTCIVGRLLLFLLFGIETQQFAGLTDEASRHTYCNSIVVDQNTAHTTCGVHCSARGLAHECWSQPYSMPPHNCLVTPPPMRSIVHLRIAKLHQHPRAIVSLPCMLVLAAKVLQASTFSNPAHLLQCSWLFHFRGQLSSTFDGLCCRRCMHTQSEPLPYTSKHSVGSAPRRFFVPH